MRNKLLYTLLLLITTQYLQATISLPNIWGDHMVLQQNAKVKIHGWGHPLEVVKITSDWNTDTIITRVNNNGDWSAFINTGKAGGPHTLTIKGYNQITISDILFGEVWLLTGQSNMEWTIKGGVTGGKVEDYNTNNDQIRLFTVTKRSSDHETYDINGHWQVCTLDNIQEFSAIGFFFGDKLQENLQVPIGMISSNWGGTPIETWIPKDTIVANDVLLKASEIQVEVPWGPVEPGRCFNAMIAPIMPYAIAGVLWYQGEGNTINPKNYTDFMGALINTWRKGFEKDFPFYFAQIAPWKDYGPESGVWIREMQRRALKIPNTGMIVTSDIGDTLDIHPRNKIAAGRRFADLVLNRTYKMEAFPVSGPLYSGLQIDDKKIIVSFDFSEGLHTTDGKLNLFEISGDDDDWQPAKAVIKNDQVILSSKKVKSPTKARFAWSNTATPSLVNSWGLPASCFTSEEY